MKTSKSNSVENFLSAASKPCAAAGRKSLHSVSSSCAAARLICAAARKPERVRTERDFSDFKLIFLGFS